MFISMRLGNAPQIITKFEERKKEWNITPLKLYILDITNLIITLIPKGLF